MSTQLRAMLRCAAIAAEYHLILIIVYARRKNHMCSTRSYQCTEASVVRCILRVHNCALESYFQCMSRICAQTAADLLNSMSVSSPCSVRAFVVVDMWIRLNCVRT